MDATNLPAGQQTPSRVWPWTSLALVAALVLVYVVVVGVPGGGDNGTEGPAIGRHLLHFRLEPLTGESQPASLDDLSGRVVLVNFWGTWCPPCRAEFPHIVELNTEFAGRDDFRLYAVSCGSMARDEDLRALRAETQEFLEISKATLPTYADPGAMSRQAVLMVTSDEAGGFAYPTTIVLDRQGAIRGFWQGFSRAAVLEMRTLVERLLEQTSAEPAKS